MPLVCAVLAACAPEGTFDFEVSEAARTAPWPTLSVDGNRPVVLPEGQDQAIELTEAAQDLRARAAALRQRASALSGPVVGPDDPAARAFGG